MKKLLALTLSLASIGFASSVEAKAGSASIGATVENSAAAQWGRNRGNRRVRVFHRTRIVRIGRRLYRETYQIRQFSNGRTTTRLISRVRIR
jgi:hypothetical protein